MPLPKVKAVSESEAFKVVKTGKSRRNFIKRFALIFFTKVNKINFKQQERLGKEW